MTAEEKRSAFEHIREANKIFKRSWDHDPDNHLAHACYKSTNVVVRLLVTGTGFSELKATRFYTFTRLQEAFKYISKFLRISEDEAKVIGEYGKN